MDIYKKLLLVGIFFASLNFASLDGENKIGSMVNSMKLSLRNIPNISGKQALGGLAVLYTVASFVDAFKVACNNGITTTTDEKESSKKTRVFHGTFFAKNLVGTFVGNIVAPWLKFLAIFGDCLASPIVGLYGVAPTDQYSYCSEKANDFIVWLKEYRKVSRA